MLFGVSGLLLLLLMTMMELARQYEAPMHAAFVDFSKAFDLVNHRVLT